MFNRAKRDHGLKSYDTQCSDLESSIHQNYQIYANKLSFIIFIFFFSSLFEDVTFWKHLQSYDRKLNLTV